MKQEFKMTREEMNDIISINKNQMPVMKIGNVITGMDLQEKVNEYWKGLGEKYGFKPLTVEPSAKGELYFLAEPSPVIVPKTATELEIEKYIGESPSISYNNSESLKKIVTQLEGCGYESEAGVLVKNVAFLALKKLAGL